MLRQCLLWTITVHVPHFPDLKFFKSEKLVPLETFFKSMHELVPLETFLKSMGNFYFSNDGLNSLTTPSSKNRNPLGLEGRQSI